jgi:hypothetical protein
LGSKQGPVVGSCEHNEVSGSIKFWEFLERLSKYWLLKDSVLFSKLIENINVLCRSGLTSFKGEAVISVNLLMLLVVVVLLNDALSIDTTQRR